MAIHKQPPNKGSKSQHMHEHDHIKNKKWNTRKLSSKTENKFYRSEFPCDILVVNLNQLYSSCQKNRELKFPNLKWKLVANSNDNKIIHGCQIECRNILRHSKLKMEARRQFK